MTFTHIHIYSYTHLLIYTLLQETCNGLWELHLDSLDEVCKYFFAHDKQRYARLVPLYLTEMTAVQSTTKQIRFCAVGVDHGLEHIYRIIKITGGLVGIPQNASARERFFLAEEAHKMAGSPTATRKEHHDLCGLGRRTTFFTMTCPWLCGLGRRTTFFTMACPWLCGRRTTFFD